MRVNMDAARDPREAIGDLIKRPAIARAICFKKRVLQAESQQIRGTGVISYQRRCTRFGVEQDLGAVEFEWSRADDGEFHFPALHISAYAIARLRRRGHRGG